KRWASCLLTSAPPGRSSGPRSMPCWPPSRRPSSAALGAGVTSTLEGRITPNVCGSDWFGGPSAHRSLRWLTGHLDDLTIPHQQHWARRFLSRAGVAADADDATDADVSNRILPPEREETGQVSVLHDQRLGPLAPSRLEVVDDPLHTHPPQGHGLTHRET